MNNNLSTHNQTVPTTVGALLTEECTIDPLSHLPSFLELTFVDVARNSGRKALSAAWGVGIVWLEGTLERLRQLERILERMASRLNGRGHSSSRFRLLRVVRALAFQLGRARVMVLRRLCLIFLGTVKTLGPELQALIMYAIDYNCMHYLAGATACEMVYGLKRSKIVKARSVKPRPSLHANNSQHEDTDAQYQHRVADLSKFEKTCSALFATLLPYCKDRCDRSYSEWKEQPNGRPVYNSPRNIITDWSVFEETKQKFVDYYPHFHMVHEGSIFLYQFAYLMGFTHYWSFSLHALGVMLRRMTVADVQQQKKRQLQTQQPLRSQPKDGALPPLKSAPKTPLQSHTNNVIHSTKKNSLQTKLSIPQLLRGAVLFSVSYTLLSGWYSHFRHELRLRRRRWIAGDEEDESPLETQGGETNEGESRRRSRLPIPPPPMPPNALNEEDRCIDKWSCPICKEARINPTASASGYVFCYKCLVSHIRQRGNYCPVTGMPCREDKVVRLYEPTASRRGVAGGIKMTNSRQYT